MSSFTINVIASGGHEIGPARGPFNGWKIEGTVRGCLSICQVQQSSSAPCEPDFQSDGPYHIQSRLVYDEGHKSSQISWMLGFNAKKFENSFRWSYTSSLSEFPHMSCFKWLIGSIVHPPQTSRKPAKKPTCVIAWPRVNLYNDICDCYLKLECSPVSRLRKLSFIESRCISAFYPLLRRQNVNRDESHCNPPILF